jgi:hypothetical protein
MPTARTSSKLPNFPNSCIVTLNLNAIVSMLQPNGRMFDWRLLHMVELRRRRSTMTLISPRLA